LPRPRRVSLAAMLAPHGYDSWKSPRPVPSKRSGQG
jgi:hypothetical protein